MDALSYDGLIVFSPVFIQTLNRLKSTSLSPSFIDHAFRWILAREVARHFWSSTLLSQSANDHWILDALAVYSATDFIDQVYGPHHARDQLEFHVYLPYHFGRLLGIDDPLLRAPSLQTPSLQTNPNSDLFSLVSHVHTSKGTSWFWELRRQLGRSLFHQGLKQLHTRFKFKPITLNDLLSILTPLVSSSSSTSLDLKRWLDQQHGDEDLAEVRLYSILKSMFGDSLLNQLDPQTRRWVHHQGIQTLGQALTSLLHDQSPADLNQDALKSLLLDLMKTDPKIAQWVPLTQRMLDRPTLKPSDILREIGQEVAKDDEKTGLIFQSLGLFMDALNLPDSTPSKSTPSKSTPSKSTPSKLIPSKSTPSQ
jgi:hypothetical protein